jgi:hypothetical protein
LFITGKSSVFPVGLPINQSLVFIEGIKKKMSSGGAKELKFEEARLATFRSWPANAKVKQ